MSQRIVLLKARKRPFKTKSPQAALLSSRKAFENFHASKRAGHAGIQFFVGA